MSNEIYNRVAHWNSQRYDRVHDRELTVALLAEEFEEWAAAPTAVDALDGLCDIIYVAYGALWKMNMTDNQMQVAMHDGLMGVQCFIDDYPLPPGYLVGSALLAFQKTGEAFILSHIITAAFCQMYYMGLSNAQAIEALQIVCDSNDSKSVKKTAPDVKANDGDKGDGFIRPEPRLRALLDRV